MDFRTQLLASASGWDMTENPFIQRLQSGYFSREALALYANRLGQLVNEFSRLLAHLAAISPDRAIRQHVIENLMEEEAFVFENGRLTGDELLSHISLLRHFQAHLPTPPVDSWRSQNQLLDRWLADGAWPAVAGFLFIGLEHNSPPTFERMISALRTRYSFNSDALLFFTVHLGADAVHSARGADMLATYCRDPESQALALEGASVGGRSWYLFHSLCARDMARMDSCSTPSPR